MKQKFLTKLVSAAVILTASGNSFVPMAVLAAKFDEDHYLQQGGWLYSVKADKTGTYTESKGETEESKTTTTSQDIRGIGAIVHFTLSDQEPLTLDFEKIDQRTSESSIALAENPQQEVYLTWTEPKNFKVEVVDDSGNVISTNKSYGELTLKKEDQTKAKVRITPKNENVGEYTDYVLFMDQNSRVGWPIYITSKVNKKNVSVTLNNSQIEKKYGEKLTPRDIACTVENNSSVKNLADLGIKDLSEAVSNPDDLDFSSLKVGTFDLNFKSQVETDNYSVTISGTQKLNVSKQDLKLTNIGVSGSGDTLSSYNITGQCVDAASSVPVKGTFAWIDAAQKVSAGTSYSFTFTPDEENKENYNLYTGKTNVDLEFKSDTFEGKAETTTLTIKPEFLSKTYTGGDLGFKEGEYITNYPETVKFSYKLENTNGYVAGFKPKNAGTYDVKIWIPGTQKDGKLYSSLSAQTKLTITPAELGTDKRITFNIAAKPYNGQTEAQIISIGNVDPNAYIAKKDGSKVTTKEELEQYFDAEFDTSEVGENKTVTITLTDEGKKELSLQGNNAANYKLPDSFTATGTIYQVTTNVQVKANVKKHYGQTMNFVSADFASASNLAAGDVLDDLKLVATSEGEASSAKAGTYSVTAVSSNKNYRVGDVTGNLTVEKTTPVAVGSVTASTGKAGKTADTIKNSLQGVFVNPYSKEIVPGSIKLSSGEENKRLESSTTLQYTFYPADTKDYEIATGPLTVDSELDAISLAVSSAQTFTYDGSEKYLTFTTEDKADVVPTYKNLAGEVVTPVNVGLYKVTAVATPINSRIYKPSTLNTELIIEAATVNVTFNKPEEDVTGKKLSEIPKSYTATNSKGETVPGTFSWDLVNGVLGEEETIVAPGAYYQWTFQPLDSNYKSVTDSVQLAKPAPEPVIPPDPEPEPEVKLEPDPKPEVKPDPEPDPKPEVKPDPEPDPKPEVKPDPEPDPKPEVKPETTPTPDPKPTQDPTPQGPSTQPSSSSGPSGSTGPSGAASSSSSTTNPSDDLETGSNTTTEPEESEKDNETPAQSDSEQQPAVPEGTLIENTKTNGTKETIVKTADGSTTTTTIDIEGTKASVVETANGFAGATVSLSLTAQSKGSVVLDMPAVPAGNKANSAPVEITIPEQGKEVLVSIPVENGNDGSVAVAILDDGTEVVLKKSLYKDGNLVVSIAANAKIVIRDNSKVFNDVQGDVHAYPANGIAFLSARGIMTGTGDGTSFSPNAVVTRGQVATMLYRYVGSPVVLTSVLPAGVSSTDYFADGAAWASQVGLMAVGSDFNGAKELTREQLAMILYRLEGMEGSSTEVDENLVNSYGDVGAISSVEMRKAVAWAIGNGIMGKGTANLNPSGTSIRQDLAAMIARYIQNK